MRNPLLMLMTPGMLTKRWGILSRSTVDEIQVMYNALYLIHFTVAEAKLKFC